jgi:hypothetical protein
VVSVTLRPRFTPGTHCTGDRNSFLCRGSNLDRPVVQSVKVKVKQSRYTPWRRLGGEEYSSYLFTTSALEGVSGQRHVPAALYPRYPLYRTLGGPQSRSGHRGYRKNPLPLPGIEPRSPGRPARSQTLYCLSYTGSCRLIRVQYFDIYYNDIPF